MRGRGDGRARPVVVSRRGTILEAGLGVVVSRRGRGHRSRPRAVRQGTEAHGTGDGQPVVENRLCGEVRSMGREVRMHPEPDPRVRQVDLFHVFRARLGK
ncbi:hypothetical protein QTP86_003219, partial [Hemibagrus guttatus]